jgi:hypothetical protein
MGKEVTLVGPDQALVGGGTGTARVSIVQLTSGLINTPERNEMPGGLSTQLKQKLHTV